MNPTRSNVSFHLVISVFIVSALLSPACIEAQGGLGGTGSISASIGDLDNDKDLKDDLVVLNVIQGEIEFFFNGSTTSTRKNTTLTAATDIAIVDVASPDGTGPDGLLDVLVLSKNQKMQTSQITVWPNKGKDRNGTWLGLETAAAKTIPIKEQAYDRFWFGEIPDDKVTKGDGVGADVFVYDMSSRTYTAGINQGVDVSGNWMGFSFNDSKKLELGESLSAVRSPETHEMLFVVLNGKDATVVKKYDNSTFTLQ